MYICGECAEEHPYVKVRRSMAGGVCEMHGHLKNRWSRSAHYWCLDVRRPVFERDGKKYVLDQLEKLMPRERDDRKLRAPCEDCGARSGEYCKPDCQQEGCKKDD